MRDFGIFCLVLLLASIGHIATDIYLPSMPYLVEYFGTTKSVVQLTFTAYLLSYCFAPLIVGPISDRLGRKRPIKAGIYLSLLATVLCSFATSINLLILARFLQGIGMGIIVTTGRALLPDYFQGVKLAKYFSYMSMGMAFVLALAPPIGGFIQDNSTWRMVFVCMSIYLVIVYFLVSFFMKDASKSTVEKDEELQQEFDEMAESAKNKKSTTLEDNRDQKKSHTLSYYFYAYKEVFNNKQFMLYSFCTILTVTGVISYLTASPFIFQQVLGLSATEYGLIAILLCGVVFIMGLINSKLINFVKARVLLYINSALIILSGILLMIINQFFVVNLYTLLIPIVIYFITMPISFSNAGALAMSNLKGNYGTATALTTNLQFLGGVLGSAYISLSHEASFLPLSSLYILMGILYFLVVYFARDEKIITHKI